MGSHVSFWGVLLCALVVSTGLVSPGLATTVDLENWALNINGSLYTPGSQLPDFVDHGNFNGTTGLGKLVVNLAPQETGDYFVIAFYDHEIDQSSNTYFNEYGVIQGTPAQKLSWEIDEPGYDFGDIYSHVGTGSLDNTNGVSLSDYPSGEDVSMAMGWHFSLTGLDVATLQFAIETSTPPAGFYLSQHDTQNNTALYFSSTLEVTPIPVPGTLLLLGSGVAALIGVKRRKTCRQPGSTASFGFLKRVESCARRVKS